MSAANRLPRVNGTDHAVTRNGIGHSFIRTYNFILTSVQRRLTLADFANIKLDCANDNTIQDGEDSHRWLYIAWLNSLLMAAD